MQQGGGFARSWMAFENPCNAAALGELHLLRSPWIWGVLSAAQVGHAHRKVVFREIPGEHWRMVVMMTDVAQENRLRVRLTERIILL